MEELSLQEFLLMLIKHFKLIAVLVLLGGLFTGGYYVAKHQPQYETTAQVLISMPKSEKTVDAQQDNVEMSRLINTSSVLLKNNLIIKPVQDKLSTNYNSSVTSSSIKESTEITNEQGSQIISVKVTDKTPKRAQNTANLIVSEFKKRAPKLIGIGKVVIVRAAKPSNALSNTRAIMKNVIAGVVLGFFAACIIIFSRELGSKRVRTTDYILKKYNLQLLGEIQIDHLTK